VENCPLLAVGWLDKKLKTFIATSGDTSPGTPHVTRRDRVVDGKQVSREHSVKRSKLVEEYFNAANAVDVHNHLRQGGLGMEKRIRTKSWKMRLFCTIIGIIETDAFLAYRLETEARMEASRDLDSDADDDEPGAASHTSFTEKLIDQLLDNVYKNDHLQLRQRVAEQLGVSFSPDQPMRGHVLASFSKSQFYTARMENGESRGTCQRRCRICSKRTRYYCAACSTDSPDANVAEFLPLCGPSSSSDMHCLTTHTSHLVVK